MREIILDGKTVNDESEAYVIAEIGSNHCGDLELCKEMIRAAKECGCDAVKLQKRTNRELYTDEFYNKPYDNPNSYGKTYGEHREALEFGWDQYCILRAFSEDIGITFFATPFDIQAADFLEELGVPMYKIASGDLTNIPLIQHVAGFHKPMIISTGGGTTTDMKRVEDLLFNQSPFQVELEEKLPNELKSPYREALRVKYSKPEMACLQCTAAYPAKIEQMNLRFIEILRQMLPDRVVGLSDHYGGILSGPIAFMYGARIFEKHFTFGHSMKGTDHAFSLKPDQMKRFVTDLRRIKSAMADVKKEPLPEEAEPIRKMGKAVYLKDDYPVGTIIRGFDFQLLSPADGIPPYELESLIGKKTLRDIKRHEPLKKEYFG